MSDKLARVSHGRPGIRPIRGATRDVGNPTSRWPWLVDQASRDIPAADGYDMAMPYSPCRVLVRLWPVVCRHVVPRDVLVVVFSRRPGWLVPPGILAVRAAFVPMIASQRVDAAY